MDYQLIDNEIAKRYEFHVDGVIPKIDYKKAKGKIYLVHTEVPEQLKGKGIASALVKKVLEDIRQKEITLVSICPFVAMYIKRHPEWESLL